MNKRNWLIFEDARQTPEARAAFDRAVAQVNDGTAQVRKLSGESIRGFVVDGQKILGQAVLEYVLEGLSASRDVSPAGTPVPVERPPRRSTPSPPGRSPSGCACCWAGMISTTCCIAGSTAACAIRIS